ncbi:MAG: hypothetical protein M3167_03170 [Acidobacteriota bacterium]|nr:hypothetical protein [Acidobacteriota bacterium]
MVMRRARASEPASRGSVGRLWAEFNDPGPAGDTLVFMKRYADGIVPGCMGLVFLLVGLGVMGLFFHLAIGSDKKTWLPILFGAVFATAGYGVLRLGIRNVLRKSGG